MMPFRYLVENLISVGISKSCLLLWSCWLNDAINMYRYIVIDLLSTVYERRKIMDSVRGMLFVKLHTVLGIVSTMGFFFYVDVNACHNTGLFIYYMADSEFSIHYFEVHNNK
ncbi:hypothetical protein CHUAL_013994 [Chamberlinius hualienensis]